MYKKILLYLIAIAAVAFFINSCQDSTVTPPGDTQNQSNSGLNNFNASLPTGCVTMSNTHHDFTKGAYWNFNLSNAGILNGTYNAWCIDLAHAMLQNTTFECAKMYSSLNLSSIPPQDIGFPFIDHPENFDKINYLLNHFQVGQPVPPSTGCPTAAGNITVVDLQAIIWYYLDETPQSIDEWVNGPLADWAGLYSLARIHAILCDVDAHGEGFVPNCTNGDLISVIIIPDGQNVPFTVQPIIITLPCDCLTPTIPTGCVILSGTHHNLSQAFWNFNLSNATPFNGNWNGWCVDLAHAMLQNTTFNCAKMYSSLNPSSIPPPDIGFPYIDHPENFDKINYLLNKFQVGQPLPPLAPGCTTSTGNISSNSASNIIAGSLGNVTAIDIQAVVWYYLDETPQNIEEWVNGPLKDWEGLYDINRIKAIICDVNANGEGFVPNCSIGDLVAIIVIPDGQNIPFTVQPIIFTVPCDCP